jgi:hypothetical protein
MFRRRLQCRQPFAQPALELRPRALLLLLAVEARLHRLAGGGPAGAACMIDALIESLPTPIDVDHGAHDRSRLCRQHLERGENRVGGFRVVRALGHRIETLPGETRDAAIFVLRRVRELAQTLRRLHAFGRVVPRFRDFRGQGEVDQQILVADERQRGAAPIGIRRAARHVDADRVRAGLGLEVFGNARAIRGFGQHRAERRGKRRANGGLGFRREGRRQGRQARSTAAPPRSAPRVPDRR